MGSERMIDGDLEQALRAFADGSDRSTTAVERIHERVVREEDVPWRDELLWATGKFGSGLDGTGPDELAALAQIVLADAHKTRSEPRWRLRVPDDAKGLDARWRDESGRARAGDVLAALRTGRDLPALAFGTHEGRLDLRGFVDPRPDEAGRAVADLVGLDLTGATFGSLTLTKRTIANCRFDGATIADLRLWSSSITDSSFRGARLDDTLVLDGRTAFGRGPRSEHRRVDFSGANLAGLRLGDALFEDCDFSNAKLAGAILEGDIVRCRFEGHLHDVAFYGRRGILGSRVRHEDVDLTGAELHYVGFRGVDLADFGLPDDPRVLVIDGWPRIRRWLEARYPDGSAPLAVRLAMSEEPRHTPKHGKMVLELATIEEDAGPDGVSELKALLIEAAGENAR